MGELAWVDVETTGLDPTRHELLEVCVIRTTAGLEELSCYSSLVLPERLDQAEPRALELVRYSPVEWAASAVSPSTAIRGVCLTLYDATLAGHNVGFDRRFLQAAAERAGVAWPRMDYHRLDTMALAWPLLAQGRVRSLSLQALADALEVPRQGPAHRAEADVRTAIAVARELLRRWQLANDGEAMVARLTTEVAAARTYAVGLVRDLVALQESLGRADACQRQLSAEMAKAHNELTALRAQVIEQGGTVPPG